MDDQCREYDLRSRWTIVHVAVGPEGVAFRSPPLYEYLSFFKGVEDLSIQQLVSEFPAETLTIAVFSGAARFDVEGSYSCSFKPLACWLSGEF